MKKKIVLGLAAAGTALAMLPMLAAFEAHVINVTARIENALSVSTKVLDFGTVFPQEHLAQNGGVKLSDSFIAEDRVDDVEYFIRQKPKCAITRDEGKSFDPTNTRTGHVNVDDGKAVIDCGQPPRQLESGESWGVLPSLCEYVSKDGEKDDEDLQGGVDGITPSFHKPWQIVNNAVVWLDTKGRLAKSAQDVVDEWVIDLSVPCFGGYCAQDWEKFVHDINPNANPAEYTQPIGNEHKVFGCNLWVEVKGVSETPIED